MERKFKCMCWSGGGGGGLEKVRLNLEGVFSIKWAIVLSASEEKSKFERFLNSFLERGRVSLVPNGMTV